MVHAIPWDFVCCAKIIMKVESVYNSSYNNLIYNKECVNSGKSAKMIYIHVYILQMAN